VQLFFHRFTSSEMTSGFALCFASPHKSCAKSWTSFQSMLFTGKNLSFFITESFFVSQSVLANITGALVNIDSYRFHEGNDGTVDQKKYASIFSNGIF